MRRTHQIRKYITHEGKCPFDRWLGGLDTMTANRIMNRLVRVSAGNLGDYKHLHRELHEFRMDFGPGYRIYFLIVAPDVILLLGGDKGTQSRDIQRCLEMMEEWRKQA